MSDVGRQKRLLARISAAAAGTDKAGEIDRLVNLLLETLP